MQYNKLMNYITSNESCLNSYTIERNIGTWRDIKFPTSTSKVVLPFSTNGHIA